MVGAGPALSAADFVLEPGVVETADPLTVKRERGPTWLNSAAPDRPHCSSRVELAALADTWLRGPLNVAAALGPPRAAPAAYWGAISIGGQESGFSQPSRSMAV